MEKVIGSAEHYTVSGENKYWAKYHETTTEMAEPWDSKYGDQDFEIKCICDIGEWGFNHKNIKALAHVEWALWPNDPKYASWVDVATINPKFLLKSYFKFLTRFSF